MAKSRKKENTPNTDRGVLISKAAPSFENQTQVTDKSTQVN